jgi:integrase/recombinase XerD
MENSKIIRLRQPNQIENKNSFIELMRNFDIQDSLENDHSPGTRYKYRNITDNFERYLMSIQQINITPDQLTVPLIKNFVLWLSENLRSCDRTHIAKHVSRIKKAADFIVNDGIIAFNPFGSYHVKRAKNKPVIHLDDSEFSTWTNAVWQSEIYIQCQDIYTFQMVTGISYGDLFPYKVVNDPGTGLWIEGARNKTKRPFYVPLFHQDFIKALLIHQKYNGNLPFIENHFYNRIIREMAKILGIEKYLTSHVARKTFATLSDQNGKSVPWISAILGNTEKICSTNYIAISKKKIYHELKKGA